MSYLVLARKCRPATFEEVVAQGHITDTIKNALAKDRLAHAYLFCGPRGTGKTTTARILAKALNCENSEKPTPEPCGKCNSCVSIAGSRSPDVLEIDGASNRGIAEIQALRERVQYAPRGRYKVFIIDEVHMLTKEAFNALLKTLEEPPPQVMFIFATTEPQKLPSTITSRCQRYDFRRIPANIIAEEIGKIASNEGLTLTEDATVLIANRADGAFRDSLSILDQILAYSPKGELSSKEISEILGILPLEAFDRIARNIAMRDPSGAINELDTIIETGVNIIQIAEGLAEHFHGTLMSKLGVDIEGISQATQDLYRQFAEMISSEDLLRIVRRVSELQTKLKYAAQPRFLFEQELVYLSSFSTTADIKSMLSGGGLPTSNPFPNNPSKEPLQNSEYFEEEEEIEIDDNSEKGRLINLFGKKRGQAKAEWLKQAELISDEKRIILRFPHSLDYQVNNILRLRNNMETLKEAAEEVFGEGTIVDLDVQESQTNDNREQPKASKGKVIPDGVKSILDSFDAKLEE